MLPVGGRLDVDDADPEEVGVAVLVLPDADADAVALGLLVFGGGLGLAAVDSQGRPVGLAAAFLLPVALVFAVAEAVAVALLVARLLAVAGAVLVAEAVPVAEALSLPDGLTLELPLAGLPLVPSLELLPTGEVCEPCGDALGFTGLLAFADRAAAADEEGDTQTVGCALLWLDDVLAGPAPPFAGLAALPEPSRLGAFPLALDDAIPTADPSWTKASRSGGRARTTPMANTAQAAARTGLSSPSRQSRGRCRAPPRAAPRRACSSPPRPVAQRPRPARKPPSAAECLLARAGPDRTRARIRSSPSGCGSTWSAAACSARRRYSPKSIGSGPCGRGPSKPDLVITLAPGPRAGRSCRGRCGS
ncbi:MAG TPA: hypothetical protein VFQ68_40045 [Streptosporangiaceae bacterium]|nr:hypothetical protein [Streptosporangiaceae bacterium]